VGKLVVFESITLDGVMQGPGRADEDTRGGFQHGGWATRYADEVTGQVAAEGMATTGALLLGRRTYEDFYSFWPSQPDNPFTTVLTNIPKYVASRTLEEPLPWANSTLLRGEVGDAIGRLKGALEKDLVVLGSGDLVETLMHRDLIDRYILLIHPLVLGTGQRLFVGGSPTAALQLVASRVTTTGVMIATYEPKGLD
jgi:dihydrofolate reductase